jgi:hypothetical protein
VGGEVCGSTYKAVDDVLEDEDSCGFDDAFGSRWVERPETPVATMTRKTRVLIAMSAMVTI